MRTSSVLHEAQPSPVSEYSDCGHINRNQNQWLLSFHFGKCVMKLAFLFSFNVDIKKTFKSSGSFSQIRVSVFLNPLIPSNIYSLLRLQHA